jgi:hypothetical protein
MTCTPVTCELVLLFFGDMTSCMDRLLARDVLSSVILGILVPFESVWACCTVGIFLSLESEPILLEVKLFVLGYCLNGCAAVFGLRR